MEFFEDNLETDALSPHDPKGVPLARVSYNYRATEVFQGFVPKYEFFWFVNTPWALPDKYISFSSSESFSESCKIPRKKVSLGWNRHDDRSD